MANKTLEQKLAKARQEKARAEAKIKSAAAKIREADRRADARRKIIIGGAIFGRAASNQAWAKELGKIVAALPERDRAAFDGWTLPAPEASAPAVVVIQEGK